jgi:hypothetical protein
MLLDTRNKNMYRSGVGISMVFKILRHILFKGDWTTMYTVMTCIPSDASWHKKIHGLGVVIMEIFGHFLFKGDRTIPYDHDRHAI